jgi:hypothetical protein
MRRVSEEAVERERRLRSALMIRWSMRQEGAVLRVECVYVRFVIVRLIPRAGLSKEGLHAVVRGLDREYEESRRYRPPLR